MLRKALAFSLVLTLLGAASARGGSQLGELRIVERSTFTGAVYIEGAYQYVRVTRTSDGSVVHRERSANGLEAKLKLAPGFYRLRSWTQTCSGNCDQLDAPSYRCAGSFRVRAGRYLTASIRTAVGEACRITNP